jgi:hypothetical protein
VTPAFSQAWISADPASIDTFLPSIVSSTSARRCAVVEKARVALAACLLHCQADLPSVCLSIASIIALGTLAETDNCLPSWHRSSRLVTLITSGKKFGCWWRLQVGLVALSVSSIAELVHWSMARFLNHETYHKETSSAALSLISYLFSSQLFRAHFVGELEQDILLLSSPPLSRAQERVQDADYGCVRGFNPVSIVSYRRSLHL